MSVSGIGSSPYLARSALIWAYSLGWVTSAKKARVRPIKRSSSFSGISSCNCSWTLEVFSSNLTWLTLAPPLLKE